MHNCLQKNNKIFFAKNYAYLATWLSSETVKYLSHCFISPKFGYSERICCFRISNALLRVSNSFKIKNKTILKINFYLQNLGEKNETNNEPFFTIFKRTSLKPHGWCCLHAKQYGSLNTVLPDSIMLSNGESIVLDWKTCPHNVWKVPKSKK